MWSLFKLRPPPLLCLSVSHFEFEAVDDVLDVGAGQRLSEAQLFGEIDLVVELVQLLQKLLLRHRTVQDGAARTRGDVRQTLFHTSTAHLTVVTAVSSHRSLRHTYEIMAPGTTSSSTSWLRWLRTACLFFSRTFMLTDCCCRVWISLLMEDRSLWKPLSMPSMRWKNCQVKIKVKHLLMTKTLLLFTQRKRTGIYVSCFCKLFI